jgi:predicted SnoaL-like aldol condensation-catalyzing enzyme
MKLATYWPRFMRGAAAAAIAIFAPALALAGAEQSRNAQSALTFMSSWAKVPATELANQFLADDMVQHGAAFKDGKSAYRDFIAALAPQLNPQQPPAHRVAVSENDLVVLLADQSVDMFRFNRQGKVIEKWGYRQPQGAAIGEPAGTAGHEERNRRRGRDFLEGLTAVTTGKFVQRYLAADFKRLDGNRPAGREEFAAALADALAQGARWHVKHSIAERDMVVFVAANDQPSGPSPPPAGNTHPQPALADPEALGSRNFPGCGEGAGYASPERGKPGRAAVIALRFNESGKITEYWQVEQPFNAFWACAGRWHANSLF